MIDTATSSGVSAPSERPTGLRARESFAESGV
jgi:hypothetical protein